MAYKKKSWVEKLNDSKDFPRVEKLTPKLSKQWGAEGTAVIPTPREVDDIMKNIPKGKLTIINDIRKVLAKKHNATISCPICTGIFATISAHAAEEEKSNGKKNTTPYWRTLKAGGEINPKYPGGVEEQKKFLEAEGHEIYQKGKKWLVYNFENKLAKL
jgi:alkylated DNA nucleotide flippase Atl1